MKHINLKPTILLIFLSVFLLSCLENKGKKHKKKDKQEKTALPETLNLKDSNSAINCDTTFWEYVYNPERLEIINKCKTVTGVIEESNVEEDGDQHMLLKLDNGQEGLLTKKNIKKKQGDLVIEAVCANKPTVKKVGNKCEGYINKIQIPELGKHVKVTGSLVIDSHNGWAEIHPITKIELMK